MKKSLTLAEVMISVFIFVVGVGAIFYVYPSLFEGVDITFQTMRAWGLCRQEMETLKNTSFDTLWAEASSGGTPYSKAFSVTSGVIAGRYYLQKVGTATDILKITVEVSVRTKNRTIGGDTNLNGELDGGEPNIDGILESPISLTTLVVKSS